MKISRIPNFGSFGVFVDDVDMDNMDDQQWHELGKLFVKELVLIFRNINISKVQYADYVPKWGPYKSIIRRHFYKKYGSNFDATLPDTWGDIDSEDREWLKGRTHQLESIAPGRYLTRVYGRKDSQGNALGYFSHGEIFWHSNEGSSLIFSPVVCLLGWEAMEGSATGFMQTVDLYESLSESFRSELNDMVLIHEYIPGKINENEFTDDHLRQHLQQAFCPVNGDETPLVCTAPNGRRGLHYTVNSRSSIKGMTADQTQKLFDKLDGMLFTDKNIYDHYYRPNQTDLLFFDNSVTLHRRLGGKEDRKAFRSQIDVSPLLDAPWRPWQHMMHYDNLYKQQAKELVEVVGGDLQARFKLP